MAIKSELQNAYDIIKNSLANAGCDVISDVNGFLIEIDGHQFRVSLEEKLNKLNNMKQPEIIESNFEHEARYKEWDAYLFKDCMRGEVEWLTQEFEHPSDEFNAEVIRAFKEAGAKNGCIIKVDYGCRDCGLTEHYVLKIS